MLVAKIRVCRSMEMGPDACGLMLAMEISGSTEMGFNACGSVLAVEIDAYGG